jgi:Family of unknown function (DUF5335)
MHTLEIFKPGWAAFLAGFNRALDGRPVRVEVVGRTLGDQEMADLQPFQGVDYDSKGSERGSLTIHVGAQLTHRIHAPSRLYLLQNDAGEIEWLAIDEGNEARTLIHFERVPELEAQYGGVP